MSNSSYVFKIASAFLLSFARERVKMRFLVSNVSADITLCRVQHIASELRVVQVWSSLTSVQKTSSYISRSKSPTLRGMAPSRPRRPANFTYRPVTVQVKIRSGVSVAANCQLPPRHSRRNLSHL
jgi:hypothetical protein